MNEQRSDEMKSAVIFWVVDALSASLFAFISAYMGAPKWATFSLFVITFLIMRDDSKRLSSRRR